MQALGRRLSGTSAAIQQGAVAFFRLQVARRLRRLLLSPVRPPAGLLPVHCEAGIGEPIDQPAKLSGAPVRRLAKGRFRAAAGVLRRLIMARG